MKEISEKPRKAWLAILASITTIGLGQRYNGQLKKGVLFSLIPILVSLFIIDNLEAKENGTVLLYFVIGFLFLWFILVVCDAVHFAKKNRNFQLKSYNRWYYYLLFIIAFSIVGEIYEPLKREAISKGIRKV